MNNEVRSVYGYLSHPSAMHEGDTKFVRGMIRCLFEEIDNKVYPINRNEFFDERNYVFLLDGYQEVLERQLKRVFRFDAVPNHNYEDNNGSHTRHVAMRRSIKDSNTDRLFSIIDFPLPDPFDTRAVQLPCYPGTQKFFLRSGDDVYGPFMSEVDSSARKDLTTAGIQEVATVLHGITVAPVVKSLNLKCPPNHIVHFKFDDLKDLLDKEDQAAYIESDGTFFFYDATRLKGIPYSTQSYVTTQEIQYFLNTLSNKRIIPKSTLHSLKMQLNNMVGSGNAHVDIFEGVTHFLDQIPKEDEISDSIIALINSSERGKLILKEHIEAQRSEYIGRWDQEAQKKHTEIAGLIESKRKELDELTQEVMGRKQELNGIKAEIDRKTAALTSDLEEVARGKAEEQARIKIDSLNKEISELEKLHKNYSDINQIQEDIESGYNRLSTLNDMIKEREKRLDEIEEQTRGSEADLRDRIRQIIPTVSALMHAPTSPTLATPAFPAQSGVFHANISSVNEASSLTVKVINSIARQFSEVHGRSYSNEFISSLLVANQQAMITILSGPPGTGKSSFVRILKDVMQQQDRFLEVRVGRHWSSERDLIGFYNTLSESYSAAPTGLYPYLKGVADDTLDKSTPHTILLDEANLSPIEHYGANILSIADMESELSIQLAHEKLSLPESLRFIATVNFDMTTEPLSPRLLDRAPVIPFEVFLKEEAQWSDEDLDWGVSAGTLQSLFGTNSLLISEDEYHLPEALQNVIEAMERMSPEYGAPIMVSRRKLSAITTYFSVLKEVLSVSSGLDTAEASDKACDFTALYYLLPSVNLFGEAGRKRMELIAHSLDSYDLKMSASKAEDILMRGKLNLDSYIFLHY